jgi:hypothetical protein
MRRSPELIFQAVNALLFATWVSASPPHADEHKVWRAAVEHVREDEAESFSDPRPLPVLARSSFPKFPNAISQLNEAAKSGFCGLNPGEAEGLVRQLVALNANETSTRSGFENEPLFRVTETRPKVGDHLGISRVLFSKDRQSAYLNLDIGGMAGAIIKMRLEQKEWRMTWDASNGSAGSSRR